MKKIIIILMVGSIGFMYSCKEEPVTVTPKGTMDDPVEQISLKESLLRTWVIQEAFFNGNIVTNQVGKTYEFFENGEYSYESTPDHGTWEFSSDSSEIVTNKGTVSEVTWLIEKLDETDFLFSFFYETFHYRFVMTVKE